MMHRTNQTPTMTEAQAATLCVQNGATFVKKDGPLAWWKLPDGTFLGVQKLGNGQVQVNRVAASACGCS